jgi:isopentenyl-diphosphate delta-isomerase
LLCGPLNATDGTPRPAARDATDSPDETSSDRRVSFDDEPLILVDERDAEIGHEDKWSCHQGDGKLHRAFSIFVFNGQGELLLQQRSAQKLLWPGIWSNSCCSHPRRGETLEVATARRLREELGFETPLWHRYWFCYHARWQDVGSERELCHVFLGRYDGEVRVNPNEIAAWRWIAADALEAELARTPERFSPWMKMEWARLRDEHGAALEPLLRGA